MLTADQAASIQVVVSSGLGEHFDYETIFFVGPASLLMSVSHAYKNRGIYTSHKISCGTTCLCPALKP